MKQILTGFQKDIIFFFVLALCASSFFTITSQVNASEVDGVGVDWKASTMQVEFSAENTEVPPFTCFGITPDNCVGSKDHCVVTDLDSLGYSDENNSPKIENCFHQAGDYKVTIQLIDFAGNSSDPDISNFTVRAGPPDQNQSIFTVSGCQTSGSTGVNIANGTDVCTFLLKVKDEYGNPVTQLNGKNGQIYSDSDFPLDANRGISFRNGLRLAGSTPLGTSTSPTTFTLSNDAMVSEQFQLSAWAPSTSEVAAHLGKNEAKQLDLNIELFTVDNNGNLDTGNTVLFRYGQYSPDIRFRPPVKTLLSFLNNPEFIVDVPNPMRLTRALTPANIGGTAGPPVNSFLRTYLYYHNLPASLAFTTASTAFFAPNTHNQRPPAGEIIDINPTIEVVGTNPQFTRDLSFSTEVEYDTVAGTVRYPSGALGSGFGVDPSEVDDLDDESIVTRMVGVSIEGDVLLGKNDNQVFSDTAHLLLGNVNFQDAREAISRSAASITRGIPVQSGPSLVFDNNWYGNRRVAVVDGDVQIGSSGTPFTLPIGENTLVIRNGNLIINGDLRYANKTDSFGFILTNDAVTPYPEKGNILVRNSVKNIVGTYFAEGGLMSISDVLPFGSATVANNNNGSLTNNTQLLLEGTLMTHNTVGGALFASNYFNPWGQGGETAGATTEGHAKTYDLHSVRQFRPLYPAQGGAMTNTGKCFSSPCDSNLNAFVIRVDGKVEEFPPPGFEMLQNIKR